MKLKKPFAPRKTATKVSAMTAGSRRLPRTLDVRPLIASGEEPFAKIMELLSTIGPGESFVLISPFIPAPLIERLQSQGFAVRPEHRPDGAWQTQFTAPVA